jgi:hypothetical protein
MNTLNEQTFKIFSNFTFSYFSFFSVFTLLISYYAIITQSTSIAMFSLLCSVILRFFLHEAFYNITLPEKIKH